MDVRALGLAAATVAGMLCFCCSEVREVPVGLGSSDDGSATGGADSTGSPSSGSMSGPLPDDQDTSTGSPPATSDEAGSTGDPIPRVQVCAQPSAPIPEDGGEWLEVVVEAPPDTSTSGMRTALRIDHPRVGDLRAELVAPDPTMSVSLIDTVPCEHPRVEAVLDDSAERSVNERCLPGDFAALEGPLQPNQLLETLGAGSAAGEWTLRIQDVEPGNEGVLEGWCLDFEVSG